MSSLWEDTAELDGFAALDKSINTDVLIIGGGMAGLLSAYMLNRAGVECCLAEAKSICGGVTKNTTAKITSQHGLIYHKLINRFGLEKARLYLEANEDALNEYRGLCRDIRCHFERQDNYIYSLDDSAVITRELEALKKIGYPARFEKDLPLPFSTQGSVCFPDQASFNPLEFVSGISKGLKIFEHTNVRKLEGTKAVTDKGEIRANKVIVATHFPFINKRGLYFLKMYQSRSYVIALENAGIIKGMYADDSSDGLSFRGYGDLLILGGGGHKTGKKGGQWNQLREFARINYPDAVEKYSWAAQDCATLDDAAYIGRYYPDAENLFVATGFNKWGMTSSMTAAKLLRDMILGYDNPYKRVFDPSRTIMRAGLAANAVNAAFNLLTPTKPRCPHMGCALKWNKEERTWDCPCHGSRFSDDGKIIDNPAMVDLDEVKHV